MRHTFNTNVRKAEVPKVTTMKLTGHNTLSMYLKYSTGDPEDAEEAMPKPKDFLDRES
ncbi:MAG: hypothetical protein ACETVU_05325 [Desulfatiglandales bacterium]